MNKKAKETVNEVMPIKKPIINLSFSEEKLISLINNIHKNEINKNQKRIEGPRNYLLIDNEFIGVIDYYMEYKLTSFRGLKASVIRYALLEYMNYLKNNGFSNKKSIEKNYHSSDLLKALKDSASFRRRMSAGKNRTSINVKIPNELNEFIITLNDFYGNDNLKENHNSWGYNSFIVNEALYFFLSGKILYI